MFIPLHPQVPRSCSVCTQRTTPATTGAEPPTVLLAPVDGVASPRVLGFRPIGDNTRTVQPGTGLQLASGVPGSELGQGLGLGLGLWLGPGFWVGLRLGSSGVADNKTGG